MTDEKPSGPADSARDGHAPLSIPDRLTDESADNLVLKAAAAQARGDLESAEAAYRAVIAFDKRHADAHNLLGTVLAQRGRLDEAERAIRRALSLVPSFPEGYFNLGLVLRQQGKLESAIAAYRRATGLRADYAEAWNNLGNALSDFGAMEEAAAAYRRAVAIRREFPEAYGNLVGALVSLGRMEDAIAALRLSLSVQPDQRDAILTLGDLLVRAGRYAQAADAFREVIRLAPDLVIAHVALIEALRLEARESRDAQTQRAAGGTAGFAQNPALAAADRLIAARPDLPDGLFHRALVHADLADALAAQRDLEACLARDPTDRMGAALSLALLQETAPPAIAPAGYVETLFDTHAEHFDTWLADGLAYAVPEAMARLVLRGEERFRGGAVCDLGCGTGLCLAALKRAGGADLAISRAVGIDLSGRMLDRARKRGLFDELYQDDAGRFLGRQPGIFDLLLAGDLFIYLGEISDLLARARMALAPDALFAFSIETVDAASIQGRTSPYVLTRSRRYAHDPGEIRRLAADLGFRVIAEDALALRMEAGSPVEGCIFLLRRDGS